MDKHLQKLLRELGDAINRAINESDEINEAMDRIRAAGHHAFLLLEATVAFDEPEHESQPSAPPSIERRLAEISDEDRRFLKALRIKFDNDE